MFETIETHNGNVWYELNYCYSSSKDPQDDYFYARANVAIIKKQYPVISVELEPMQYVERQLDNVTDYDIVHMHWHNGNVESVYVRYSMLDKFINLFKLHGPCLDEELASELELENKQEAWEETVEDCIYYISRMTAYGMQQWFYKAGLRRDKPLPHVGITALVHEEIADNLRDLWYASEDNSKCFDDYAEPWSNGWVTEEVVRQTMLRLIGKRVAAYHKQWKATWLMLNSWEGK